jgi:two-component system cell cycle sensor histidine kinase/response regulator CckA
MASEAPHNAETKCQFDSSVWQHAKTPAQGIAQAVALGIHADEVHVTLIAPGGRLIQARYPADRKIITGRITTGSSELNLFTIGNGEVFFKDKKLSLPLTINDVKRTQLPRTLISALAERGFRSFGLFPIYRGDKLLGTVACIFKRQPHRWRKDEVEAFETLSQAIPPSALSVPPTSPAPLAPAQTQSLELTLGHYKRIAQQGNIVMLTTNSAFGVSDVFGNTESLLGVQTQELLGNPLVWEKIVDPRDVAALRHRITRLRLERNELQYEVRIIHQHTKEVRWLLLRAHPRFSLQGDFLGWEGFGVDVTERREAQEAFLDQNRRLGALLEISRSLQGFADPAAVTFTGLRAVIRATEAQCGFAAFLDRDTDKLELVATSGLSEEFLTRVTPVLKGRSLAREAVDTRQSFLIGDLQSHPKATYSVASYEGLRATIVVPLVADETVYGVMLLFKRQADSFQDADFELAEAASAQISMALMQAEMLQSQTQQSASLSSLFKVSRELAKHRSPFEVSDKIMPIIRDEFRLARGWLGAVNDTGTFIVEQTAFSRDVSDPRSIVQIEVAQAAKAIRHVLKTHSPLVVSDTKEALGDALAEFFDNAATLAVVPMVTIGRVMGVFIVEPSSPATFASSQRLQLLVSIANEIATAAMANRFEVKMSEALKMRTAGLLAAGIAHNFNNLLQAIMGQVSLIDLQTPVSSPVRESSKTINEAAKRGAGLVKQLLQFATKGAVQRQPLPIAAFLNESSELYRSIVGSSISLSLSEQVGPNTNIYADPAQLQEVMTALLVNAKEAIGGSPDGEISISISAAIVRSGELGPEVAPGAYTRIDIHDNGIGMTPEQQARCFEPFFTTKNIDPATGVGLSGSGLSLAAAYSTVQQHDGFISVHSVPRDGSVFSIYLPTYASDELAPANSDVPQGVSQLIAPGVLLLGIEPGVIPFISKTLESLGHSSRAVFDSRQAGELLTKERQRWGIVLVEGDNLGSKADVTCEQLAEQFPGAKVICVCSDHNGPKQGSLDGLEDTPSRVYHLEKPITVWGLQDALKRVHEPTEPEGQEPWQSMLG